MDKNIKILLNKERSVESVNENTKVEFNMENTNKVLPLNDITTVVNSYEEFIKEREASSIYRFYGVLNGTVSNPLYNDNISIYFDENGNVQTQKIRSNEIFENDGWIGYYSDLPEGATIDPQPTTTLTTLSGTYNFYPISPLTPYIKLDDEDNVSCFQIGDTITIDFGDSVSLTIINIVLGGISNPNVTLILDDPNGVLWNEFGTTSNIPVDVITAGCSNPNSPPSTDPADDELYGDNKSALCDFQTFDPGFNRLNILDSDGKPNYMLKITYPAETKDIEIIKGSGVMLSAGIPIIQKLALNINSRKYVGFLTPINHGLKERDSIVLSGFTDNTGGNLALTQRQYNVFKIGDQNNDNKHRVFVLDIDPADIGITVGPSTIKRVVNDNISKYYVRRFQSLTDGYKDYDIYPSSFGVNYFDDKLAAYNFIKDVDVNLLKDNLGRPLSELFLTIVKNDIDAIGWAQPPAAETPNSQYWHTQQAGLGAEIKNRFWTKIGAGYLMELIYPDPLTPDVDFKVNYNVRAIGDPNYNGNTWFTGIDESDMIFDADIVEYNSFELLERPLEDIWHRINTIYRENLHTITTGEEVEPEESTTLYNGEFFYDVSGVGLQTNEFGVHFNENPPLDAGDTVGICFSCKTDITDPLSEYVSYCWNFTATGWVEINGKEFLVFGDPSEYIITMIGDGRGIACLGQSFNGESGHWLSGDPVVVTPDQCNPEGVNGKCEASPAQAQVPLNNKMEGYIYKPHNKIPIREYASAINPILDLQTVFNKYKISGSTEIQQVIDAYKVPDYATQISPYVYKWRDLLEVGEVDAIGSGVDYPFESGAHYLYLNNRFYLERQDPPCDFFIRSEELIFGTSPDDKDKFRSLLVDPSFFNYSILNVEAMDEINAGGVTDILDYNNGLKPIIVDVKLISLYGDYELGPRDTPGGCVNFSIIERKDIDDVC